MQALARRAPRFLAVAAMSSVCDPFKHIQNASSSSFIDAVPTPKDCRRILSTELEEIRKNDKIVKRDSQLTAETKKEKLAEASQRKAEIKRMLEKKVYIIEINKEPQTQAVPETPEPEPQEEAVVEEPVQTKEAVVATPAQTPQIDDVFLLNATPGLRVMCQSASLWH